MSNPSQSIAPSVLASLVALIKDWLQGFVDALKTYRHLVATLPPPHPNPPLPGDFPFSNLSEVFHWVQVVDDTRMHQVNHNYPVTISLLPGRAEHWEPLVWAIHTGNIVLGSIELDRRVYADQSVVSIDPLFILETMILAVTLRQKLIVSSRVVMIPSPGTDQNAWNEIFEVRRADANLVVRELGRRTTTSQPRFCPTCRTWLPQAGPNFCLEHLNVSIILLWYNSTQIHGLIQL
ncbi:hypothetical protein VNI00_006744 [Paramarasmius palmivorus]|uniref:Uncharacterized protein n=1 Tax=Paramarasmius palmivorus TaxID=297713 RepID=A0AAW0D834_9AGAR